MIKGHASKRSRPRGSGRRGPNKNTVFDSNGPDVRVRGTAQQIIEKYLSLARDASSSGDRVGSENYLQHADHYQRMLNEIVGARPEGGRPENGGRPMRRPNGQDDDQPGYDADQEQPQIDAEPEPDAVERPKRRKREVSEDEDDVPNAVNA